MRHVSSGTSTAELNFISYAMNTCSISGIWNQQLKFPIHKQNSVRVKFGVGQTHKESAVLHV